MRRGTALAVLFLSMFASAQQAAMPGAVLSQFKQPDNRAVDLSFVLTNPTSFPEGVVSVSYPQSAIGIAPSPGWRCGSKNGIETCGQDVYVVGNRIFDVKLQLKGYFESETVVFTYAVPQANNTGVEVQVRVGHAKDPNEITPDALFFIGLALLLAGVLGWVLTFKARDLARLGGPLGRAAGLSEENHLLSLAASSGIGSLGLALIAAPKLDASSVVIFGLSFALSALVLSYFRKAQDAAQKAAPLTPEQMAAEKARLEQMLKATKVKYMRQEIDDNTFRRIIADLELELLKLEEKERESSAPQEPAQAPPEGTQ